MTNIGEQAAKLAELTERMMHEYEDVPCADRMCLLNGAGHTHNAGKHKEDCVKCLLEALLAGYAAANSTHVSSKPNKNHVDEHRERIMELKRINDAKGPSPDPNKTDETIQEYEILHRCSHGAIVKLGATTPAQASSEPPKCEKHGLDMLHTHIYCPACEPPTPPVTRFAEFDDADHPFRKWWEKYGQYMMSGGGRKESIWAARGWIAREQMACGVEVTGESMFEKHHGATPRQIMTSAQIREIIEESSRNQLVCVAADGVYTYEDCDTYKVAERINAALAAQPGLGATEQAVPPEGIQHPDWEYDNYGRWVRRKTPQAGQALDADWIQETAAYIALRLPERLPLRGDRSEAKKTIARLLAAARAEVKK